ncbi:MAG: 50S ribosomal protein L1 [Oligoflexia bacterium]|nr:50S ribosomal protein L1 [Oligoflexia bacterium]
MSTGKRFAKALELVDREKRYSVDESVKLVMETATAKFDETIDLGIRLGVDPKQSDQQVRGAVALPHGVGKSVRVLVFAKGPKEKEAKDAGADFVGSDDLIEKINGGWLEFDKCIATPDMMGVVSKIGKILGPRGLMPNPKVGTVTFDVAKTVREEKRGKVEFKVDKEGNVHVAIGKKSLGAEKLKDNFLTLLGSVVKAKPATSKGIYLQGMTLSATMGPGVKIDVNQAQGLVS